MRASFQCTATVVAAVLLSSSAQAQLVRVPRPDEVGPAISLTAGTGLLLVGDRYDAVEDNRWFLGEAIQYRAMLDWAMTSGSLGISASIATVPIDKSTSINPTGEIQLRQLLVTFRSPESDGFHQTLEFSGGFSQWANYRGEDVLTAEEAEARNGFTFLIGYGAAFPIGSRVTFNFAQDIGMIVGSGKGVPASESRTQSVYLTRIELRIRLAGAR